MIAIEWMTATPDALDTQFQQIVYSLGVAADER